MKFIRDSWADGSPSIEIEDYDYSNAGFMRILDALSEEYKIKPTDIVSDNFEQIIADIGNMKFTMDNYNFSIGFSTAEERDKALSFLTESFG